MIRKCFLFLLIFLISLLFFSCLITNKIYDNNIQADDSHEPDVAIESKTIAEPDVAIESKTIAEPDVAVESKTIAEPDVAVESKTIAEPDIAIESKIIAEPDIAIESKTIAEPDIRIDEYIISEFEAISQLGNNKSYFYEFDVNTCIAKNQETSSISSIITDKEKNAIIIKKRLNITSNSPVAKKITPPSFIGYWYWRMWEANVSITNISKNSIVINIKFHDNSVYKERCNINASETSKLVFHPIESTSADYYVLNLFTECLECWDDLGKYDSMNKTSDFDIHQLIEYLGI